MAKITFAPTMATPIPFAIAIAFAFPDSPFNNASTFRNKLALETAHAVITATHRNVSTGNMHSIEAGMYDMIE